MSKVIYHNTEKFLTITLELGNCVIKQVFTPEELRLRTGGIDRLHYDIGWLYESLMQEIAVQSLQTTDAVEVKETELTEPAAYRFMRNLGNGKRVFDFAVTRAGAYLDNVLRIDNMYTGSQVRVILELAAEACEKNSQHTSAESMRALKEQIK
jgi:hypothetical protein